ncbi:Lrp/AsnC family transcriptional regulator [Ponticaulis profundi]|uniref:Lrp/AsnC family transcriptional regulator n=1 Tax=Ponticaulis profundi TaxID=2665222 RepID=A0ABW1S7E4_9PROT
MSEELSIFDIKILDQLQKDCSLSTVELADVVGLSQSPCWRRLQRLKEDGYIKRQVAILDRTKFGFDLNIFAFVKMRRLSEKERATFINKIEMTPEIQECYSIFGENDLLMKIQAKSMNWYQHFVLEVLMNLPGIEHVNSTATLGEIKSTTAIPVRGDLAL